MSTIAKLKFVTSSPRREMTPAAQRQSKFVAAVEEQILLVRAQVEGTVYAPTTQRWVTNELSGERERVQRPKRVKAWYWRAENGRWHLAVRYGSRVLELSKGKNAIEVVELVDVVPVLVALRTAARAGELDEVIGAACTAMRAARGLE